jgi:exodeoxyribonuclease VII small subunit
MTDLPTDSLDQQQTDSSKAQTAPSSSAWPSGWNYEATVTEVEQIINQIELGELDLAEVFSQFAVAVEQLRQCESFLTRQQQQVDLLIETLLDEPEPF